MLRRSSLEIRTAVLVCDDRAVYRGGFASFPTMLVTLRFLRFIVVPGFAGVPDALPVLAILGFSATISSRVAFLAATLVLGCVLAADCTTAVSGMELVALPPLIAPL
jgi:hypothetical protein